MDADVIGLDESARAVPVEERMRVADGVPVGATFAGPSGGEVLSMLTLAVHTRTPLSRLDEMIYAYPTFHRAVSPVVRELTAGG
jgi:pyruvate/2-oxoglutarate dehydrogenase complex dihydrolipoamide dehydrogenase (E3) component